MNLSAARSLAALVLAVGVTISIVALAIGAAWTEGSHNAISSQASTLLSTVLGAAVGAVAAYLGGRISSDASASSEQPTEVWPARESE